MILTAHQPVYLPWLGLFHKIALAETFVYFDEVQYLPKDWNNRNQIKTPTGPIWLTVPVLDQGYRDKTIRELEINNALPWRRKHWRSLQINYGHAPFFNTYAGFFEEVYKKDWKYLTELNEYLLHWFLETLDIHVKFLKASEGAYQGAKSELVLDMCRKVGASVYIFGALGRDYARAEDFAAHNIKIVFQDYKHPVYPQLHGEFASHLSVVDLLFNCGPESNKIIMSGQERTIP